MTPIVITVPLWFLIFLVLWLTAIVIVMELVEIRLRLIASILFDRKRAGGTEK